MATETARETHHRHIRILHWLIVALIIGQWISASWMEAFFESIRDTPAPGPLPHTFGAAWHMSFGAAILLLMSMRFILRLKVNTPDVPRDLPWPLRLLARLTHFAFYFLLVALPTTGMASLMFARDFVFAHLWLKNALLVLAALHMAGVLFHMIVLRDGLLWRMVKRPADRNGRLKNPVF